MAVTRSLVSVKHMRQWRQTIELVLITGAVLCALAAATRAAGDDGRAAGDGVSLLRSYEGADQEGDGTVPRISATPAELEREANAMFASERHASLQNEDAVLVQLRGVMSGLDIDFPGFRDAFPTIGLGLELEDVYQTGEPVPVRVHPEEELAEPLVVQVCDAESNQEVGRETMIPADEGWHEAELPPLAEGTYRLTAFGSGRVESVTDVFLVLGEDE